MKKILIIAIALIFVLALSGVALALGPHGGYVDTTNYCASCHDVHDAKGPSDSAFGNVLLQWTTVFGACQYCHDGTAGQDGAGINVWNVINNNGGTIQARHRPTATVATLYGWTNPTGTTGMGLNADTTLTCTSCHSVHDAPSRVITNNFSSDVTITASSHLLLRDPANNGYSGATVTYYGAWWCADCHVNRHDGTDLAGMNNHPINANTTMTYAGYNGSAFVAGSQAAGLNRSNVNFKMQPVPGATGARTDPICMHCHEDARDVETVFTAPTVTVGMSSPTASAYWTPTATNPRFFAFPHESTNLDFRIETADDLCLNCHATASLP